MAQVLLDNATITSAFRALGLIPIADPDLLDIEQTALERLTEAVLLADKVLLPDNYKKEFRKHRMYFLNDECFEHVPVEPVEDREMSEISGELCKVWFDSFQAGSERGTFSRYFEQARTFSLFIWERQGSVFYLVFRALGHTKDNPLVAAFLASPTDYNSAKNVRILAENGEPVEWKKLSTHVQRMVAVLAWLGNQYIWHQVFAAKKDVIYLSHPLREFFAYDFLNRLKMTSHSASEFAKAFNTGMDAFQDNLFKLLESMNLVESAESPRLPNFLPLVLSHASNGGDFLKVIYQLRNESKIVELREVFTDIEVNLSKGNIKPYKRLLEDINKLGKDVLRFHGIESSYIKISPPLALFGVSVSGDDTGIKLPIPSFLYKQYFLMRRYRAFLRSIMDELAIAPTLGKYKDKINGFAKIRGTRYSPFYSKDFDLDRFSYRLFEKNEP
jgi:hypothetical protein